MRKIGDMDVLFEIGTEELPASAVYEGLDQMERFLPELLDKARLSWGDLRVLGTPRRLAALVTGIPEVSASETVRKKGPPAEAARDPDGSWSRAARGFARSHGVGPDDLVFEKTPGGEYLFVVREIPGRPAGEVLPGVLSELLRSLKFKKSMRWGDGDERFSRPVRWLVALGEGEVLPVSYGGLRSSNQTVGHRYLSSGPVRVDSPGYYESVLEESRVVADHRRRRAEVVEKAGAVCSRHGFRPVLNDEVLAEVTQLVEWPGVVMGRFDERYLKIPRDVLVHVMEEHQRYFPVEDADGRIKAAFISVHNGDPAHADVIVRGHQRVLAARLADAEFFMAEDLKKPLGDRMGDLEHVVYQSELGSMAEKSARLVRLVGVAGETAGFEEPVVTRAQRAAELSKCDLVTHLVIEFPALQGVVGSIYAVESGEDARVARAILEQYLPRRQGDSLPDTPEGVLLSLAEKADNLAASFGLGHVPTGSEDPYALRRQVLGILLITMEHELPISVTRLVRASAAELEGEAHGYEWSDEAEAALAEFFRGREKVFFTDRGYRYDLVEAALSVDWDRPVFARRRLDALVKARDGGLLARLYTAFERCYNLSKGHEAGDIDADLFEGEPERRVFALLTEAGRSVERALAGSDFDKALGALEPLCAPVDLLFDEVLIMDEDPRLRANRLSLIGKVAALFNKVADFAMLVWD